MAKPVGLRCNLRCAYCFYLDHHGLAPGDAKARMSPAVLDAYVRQYLAVSGHEATFAWQGGEPLLAGLDFYREAIALQRRYAAGRTVHNTLQTNGTLLDDAWASFLAEHGFLVGLSLDGPATVHDRYRTTAGGRQTWDRVMAGGFASCSGMAWSTTCWPASPTPRRAGPPKCTTR